MTFTVTSTRYYNNKPVAKKDVDPDQLASYNMWLRLADSNYHKSAKSKNEKPANYYLVAAKILITLAAKHELSIADQRMHDRLRVGWKRVYDELVASKLPWHMLREHMSDLGLWFPDIPSPAYGRQYYLINHMRNRISIGEDITTFLISHDILTFATIGRRRKIQHFDGNIETEPCVVPYPTNPFADKFYAGASRNLRMLLTLKKVKR